MPDRLVWRDQTSPGPTQKRAWCTAVHNAEEQRDSWVWVSLWLLFPRGKPIRCWIYKEYHRISLISWVGEGMHRKGWSLQWMFDQRRWPDHGLGWSSRGQRIRWLPKGSRYQEVWHGCGRGLLEIQQPEVHVPWPWASAGRLGGEEEGWLRRGGCRLRWPVLPPWWSPAPGPGWLTWLNGISAALSQSRDLSARFTRARCNRGQSVAVWKR